jgi:hypothetical protein
MVSDSRAISIDALSSDPTNPTKVLGNAPPPGISDRPGCPKPRLRLGGKLFSTETRKIYQSTGTTFGTDSFMFEPRARPSLQAR